jgi:hypothetical protein
MAKKKEIKSQLPEEINLNHPLVTMEIIKGLYPSKTLTLEEYLRIIRFTPENNTYSVNKHILKVLGPLYTIYLTNLADIQKEKGTIIFQTNHNEQIEKTGLTNYEIRKSKSFFKKIGILKTNKKGIPAKEYYEINYNLIENLFCIENTMISPQERNKPEVIKLKKLIGRAK